MDQEIISISVQKLGLNKNKRFYSYSVFEEESFNNAPLLNFAKAIINNINNQIDKYL